MKKKSSECVRLYLPLRMAIMLLFKKLYEILNRAATFAVWVLSDLGDRSANCV